MIAIFIAGSILPFRKVAKTILTSIPASKKFIVSILKFLGKYHVLIGFSTLLISLFHGISLFLSEGELETEGFTGILALLFLLFASFFGIYLLKNKKSKSVRRFHLSMLTLSVSIGVLHIFIS